MEHAADISLVIPAWNEAAFLPRLLKSAEAARQAYSGGADRVEMIVADNASTDATADIARQHGCRVATVSRRAIAAARNGGAALASGRIVAFADADLRLHPQTFNYISAVMQSGRYCGGATGLVMERWSLGIAVVWYTILPALWLAGYDGGVVFCLREDFEALGGYDEATLAGEDVQFMKRLMRLGRLRTPRQRYATHFAARKLGLPSALAINSCRKFDEHGEWHLFPVFIKTGLLMLFSRRASESLIRRYWYSGR